MSDSKQEGTVEQADQYKVNNAAVKNVNDLMERDKDDESLRKWKEALLGASASNAFSPKDDPRRVVVTEFAILFKDHPEIVFKLNTPEDLKKLKETSFTMKEGCLFKRRIKFRVQHELITGLKYQNVVHRGPFSDKDVEVIGSFGPQEQPHEVTIPRREFDQCPDGMLMRGSYTGQIKLIDDDKNDHLSFEYKFKIDKDW